MKFALDTVVVAKITPMYASSYCGVGTYDLYLICKEFLVKPEGLYTCLVDGSHNGCHVYMYMESRKPSSVTRFILARSG